MAEIKLQKRVVYAGDVHIALLKDGWSIADATKFVRELPTAEVEPVRHTTFKDGECMACGWFGDCVDTPHYNYCPGCGARADGGADNG